MFIICLSVVYQLFIIRSSYAYHMFIILAPYHIKTIVLPYVYLFITIVSYNYSLVAILLPTSHASGAKLLGVILWNHPSTVQCTQNLPANHFKVTKWPICIKFHFSNMDNVMTSCWKKKEFFLGCEHLVNIKFEFVSFNGVRLDNHVPCRKCPWKSWAEKTGMFALRKAGIIGTSHRLVVLVIYWCFELRKCLHQPEQPTSKRNSLRSPKQRWKPKTGGL